MNATFVSVIEAMKMTGLSRDTIRGYIHAGILMCAPGFGPLELEQLGKQRAGRFLIYRTSVEQLVRGEVGDLGLGRAQASFDLPKSA